MRAIFTNYLEPISYLIATIILLLFSVSNNLFKVWVLFVFNLLAAILMLLASLKVLPQINNIIEYDLLLLLASWCIGFYFYFLFEAKISRVFCICIIVLSTINFILQSHTYFDSLGFYLFSLCVVIMIFIYFIQLLKKSSEESILMNFNFWINVSFLIYHLGAIIIFLSIYILTNMVSKWQDRVNIGNLWAAQNILLFLSALCLSYGFIWITFHKKSSL